MARTFNENERLDLINKVGNYFLYSKEKPSCRRCVEYLKNNGVSISVATVKDYLDKFVKANPSLGKLILDRISANIPKTVEDEKVRNRVLIAANMIANGLNIDDVVRLTGASKDVIYRDVTDRIFLIDDELGKKVRYVLEQNSRSNLMHGNDAYLNQMRNEDGTFKK